MKKYIILLFMAMLIGGYGPANKEKSALVKVNNYEISKEEFEEEFKTSSFGMTDTEESRHEFLDNLIDRKLILQDAQKKGLDREPGFLKSIERFWEQSLLKIAIDKKSKEIVTSISVKDRELTKIKESQLMEDWMLDLRKKADIKINYDLLTKGNR